MHIPVLYHEVISHLNPVNGSRFIDATIGNGGHTLGLLQASAPDGMVLGMDRDPEAIRHAREHLARFRDRLILVNRSYVYLAEAAEDHAFSDVDGVLMDLGLSSTQLDDGSRGFSFQKEGPLDMRFDTCSGVTASDLLNTLSEDDLADILWRYGEVDNSRRIAKAIVNDRPIKSTSQLAGLVDKQTPSRGKIHPATKVFQAFRIAVNNELEILKEGLAAAVKVLRIGGVLAVISFHSLEDRIVKRFIRDQSRKCTCPPEYPICICQAQPVLRPVHRKVIRPSEEEIRDNPRSRSARMRVAEKTAEVIA